MRRALAWTGACAMLENINDDEPHQLPAIDAHGRASLLLVESLLHGLLAQSLISVETAVDIVDTARDAGREILLDTETEKFIMNKVVVLLDNIQASLAYDLK
jgi:hypothetical protein